MGYRRAARVGGVLVLSLTVGACAARLEPAPGARLVGGGKPGVVASAAGITLVARTDAWTGRPRALEAKVIPVLVTLENGSDRPVRVRHEDFALVAEDGRRFAGVAPFDIDGVVTEPVAALPLAVARPYHWRFGLGAPLYDPFLYDPLWTPAFAAVPLPTPDMVQLALPERVLAPQDRATGFVYFPRPPRDVRRLDLTARLVDARTGESVGTLVIPLVFD
ncbi:MAG TPA: hypothetical protein VFX28_13430 [Methylomirabilota bacterium]|nr:hypothetical protein [Methylomirabilota bacterium]